MGKNGYIWGSLHPWAKILLEYGFPHFRQRTQNGLSIVLIFFMNGIVLDWQLANFVHIIKI